VDVLVAVSAGAVEAAKEATQNPRPTRFFASEEEAHQHATEILRTFDQELPEAADRDIMLRDYAERWLADVALERDKNTVRGYRQSLETHVLPALGHLRLRSLHRQHIKTFLMNKRREGYAKNSVRVMKAPLSVLLSDAVDDGIIAVNPALQLGRRKASRADKLNAAERLQRIRPMSWDQRDAFLEAAARERPHGTLFAVLAKGGLRPGEVFALRPGRSRSQRANSACGTGMEPRADQAHQDLRGARGRPHAGAGGNAPAASRLGEERGIARWAWRARVALPER
jgi:hypothetical protein